mgnify:CR=1 FL=1|tara:strand:+ start:7035 stop:7724 length:690 start_codon:yes stop_codon:yes gene_type:complete
MKNIDDIAIVMQARLSSTRIPRKMIRSFAGSTLVDILFNKLKKSSLIPLRNMYFSAWDEELKDIARSHEITIYNRTEQSANSEGVQLQELFDWHNKIPHKYVIMVSACNPLLDITTIDAFVEHFITSESENCFAVFEKKTYYWDAEGNNLTDWKGITSMNTKFVDPVYEAAHCLYASRMDIISDGYWMNTKTPPELDLFVMNELESFDIDYEWQFEVAEKLYKNQNNSL